MRAHVISIGMVDTEDKVHSVQFKLGLNIITGRSSTGKSAILEIFDYCMGSSENNIPYGEITTHGTWFFTILSIKSKYLVIARNLQNDRRYINEQTVAPDLKDINQDYFKEEYQIRNKKDFNPELGRYFNLTIEDIEEDTEDKEYRSNNAKKGRPTIRNIMPFLLQHQNLIANKHAIFYRFDESKRREDTIEQFKIFVGFVTSEYYSLKQELADLIRERNSIEKLLTKNESEESKRIDKIQSILDTYFAITNTRLFPNPEATAEYIYKHHRRYLALITKNKLIKNIEPNDRNEPLIEYNNLLDVKLELESNIRNLTHKSLEVERTINFSESELIPSFIKTSDEFTTKVFSSSQCQFCNQENSINHETANKLNSALMWLNKELASSNYHIDSFRKIKNDIDLEIEIVRENLNKVKKDIANIESINKKLKHKIDLDNQAIRYIGRLEEYLESLDDLLSFDNGRYQFVIYKIKSIEERLKSDFNVDGKISSAERYINKQMKEIGKEFDFEEAYKDINLKFSLRNFDLYHQEGDTKVYLRSMGSGANWLYSHLSLFLALHRYFCKLGDDSIIPPILFIDQPTQVYFPANIEDNETEFNAENIVKKTGKIKTFDHDMKAVTNIFQQLIRFCKKTKEMTGIEPQIIVTDHADKLSLDGASFEDFVVARWRKPNAGFINLKQEDVENGIIEEGTIDNNQQENDADNNSIEQLNLFSSDRSEGD